MIDDTYLTGKVSLDTHPFVEHFKFVKALEDENSVAKLTIPAPAQFIEQMIMPFAQENTRKYYADNRELAEDIAAGYKKFIADVYAAGCRNLQFDDCSWVCWSIRWRAHTLAPMKRAWRRSRSSFWS